MNTLKKNLPGPRRLKTLLRRTRPGPVPALAVALFLGVWFISSPGWAGLACLKDNQTPDAVICPPPDGELVVDRQGDKVCGFGWCVTDVNGKVKCSKVPGGAAVLDQYGKSYCVGGCHEASEAFCQKLKIPR